MSEEIEVLTTALGIAARRIDTIQQNMADALLALNTRVDSLATMTTTALEQLEQRISDFENNIIPH